MNENTEVPKNRIAAFRERHTTTTENRKYMYKQIRKVAKVTLMTAGVLYIADRVTSDKDETIIEVK